MWQTVILVLFIALTSAEETGEGEATRFTNGSCIKSEGDMEKIRSTYNKYKSAPRRKDREKKYDGMKALFKERGISDKEAYVRLVYAETLAAKCTEHFSLIMPVIAGVVQNRVDIRKGNVGSVIWQYNQWASSINLNQYSHYKDFLCPDLNSELWQNTERLVQGLVSKTQKNNTPKVMTSYYFFDHYPPTSRYYKKYPKWTTKWQRLKLTMDGQSLKPADSCFGAFRNPHFQEKK